MFDQGLFTFIRSQMLTFGVNYFQFTNPNSIILVSFRFLWFLDFHWHINCKIWISFDWSIWQFPPKCSFWGFSDIWFSIIHSKSNSYSKITNYIPINFIFSLVSKYIIFVIFWCLLILWFYSTRTIGQSQCFDFDFWLFSVKSEISIRKISYLVYLYHFYSLNLIFSYLKLLLNLSLTKSTLRLKSTLLSVDRPDTYTILDYYIWSL